jgi:hypothetical protein
MDFIHHTIQWVKGEVLQGRIMLGIGILSIVGFLYFANFQQSFYKGMILPFVLLLLVLLGYGGFQVFMRPKHIEKVQQEIQINPENAHKIEFEKAQKDDKAYARLKPIWAVLFIVSLVLFFVLKNEFGKGMSFGFVIWFLVAFIFDSFLHHRLKIYLTALQQF